MSLDLENLKTKDPFNDWETDDVNQTAQASFVHIRIQQRNGRKTLTTCQGIPEDLDLKRILKAFKKVKNTATKRPLFCF
jgi:translation initiation factor 1